MTISTWAADGNDTVLVVNLPLDNVSPRVSGRDIAIVRDESDGRWYCVVTADIVANGFAPRGCLASDDAAVPTGVTLGDQT